MQIKLKKQHKRYSKYKDTGLPWLGEVPESWNMKPLKHILHLKKDIVGDKSNNYKILSLTLKGVIPRDVESGFGKFPAEYNAYQIVQQNDLIFCLFDYDVTPRTIGISKEEGLVTGAYTVFEVVKNVDPRFYYYYYLSLDVTKELLHLCTGLRNGLSKDLFFALENPLPSQEEQTTISDYLDKKTALLDRTIETKRKQIELLKEKRTSLINQAVTRGIDEKAEIKESGVEWIGEIPKSWEVRKLKTLGKAIIGLTYSPEDVVDEEDGILVLRSSNIQNQKLSFENNVFVNKIIPKKLIVKAGDILICSRNGSRHLIGKNACIDEKNSGVTFGAFMTIFRSKFWRFLSWSFNSSLFEAQSSSYLTSTINQLTTGNLNNMIVAIPSSIKEQTKIVAFLDSETQKIDQTIALIEKSITLFEEYKTSLISNVVTGKVKIS